MLNLIQNGKLQFDLLERLSRRPPLFEPSGALFWDDPYIAQQMLKFHLDPNTDAASRRPEIIERIVNWLIERLALQPGAALLDLGCGPGLYTRRFAERGLQVTGMDYSENSLRYAREHDQRTTYIHANYLTLDRVESFDVITLIYGDICVFNDKDLNTLLQAVYRALCPGGFFVFDVTTPSHHDLRKPETRWEISTGAGFWKPSPHLVLTRFYHYAEPDTTLDQYLVIEDSGETTDYRVWTHHYTPETISPPLQAHGFTVEAAYADLMGTPYTPAAEWAGIIARK